MNVRWAQGCRRCFRCLGDIRGGCSQYRASSGLRAPSTSPLVSASFDVHIVTWVICFPGGPGSSQKALCRPQCWALSRRATQFRSVGVQGVQVRVRLGQVLSGPEALRAAPLRSALPTRLGQQPPLVSVVACHIFQERDLVSC